MVEWNTIVKRRGGAEDRTEASRETPMSYKDSLASNDTGSDPFLPNAGSSGTSIRMGVLVEKANIGFGYLVSAKGRPRHPF